MGSSLSRKIQILGIAQPLWEKQFQVLKVYRATKLIQDLSDEGKAKFSLVFGLCKLWVKTLFLKFY